MAIPEGWYVLVSSIEYRAGVANGTLADLLMSLLLLMV